MENSNSRKKKKFRFTRDDAQLTILALPTTVWFLVFAFLPMFGILIAFKDYRIHAGGGFIENLISSEWVGFKNFEFLFSSNDVGIIVRNTLLYNIIFIILGIVLPVTLAIMLTQLYNKKLAKIYQTSMFLPHFLSWVVVSYFVFSFLSPDKGFINQILVSLGKEPIQWYIREDVWPYIIIFMNVWKGIGYSMIVYLASITSIDSTYYEAALIDGATKWQQTIKITLPLLKPIIIILFILSVGKIFNSDFGLFYQVPRDSGALFNVTSTIDTYVYKALTGTGNLSMSAAAAFFQSAIGFVLILVTNYIVKKVDNDNALF